MISWYHKTLDFKDLPDDVVAEAFGEARFKYGEVRSLTATLYVRLSRPGKSFDGPLGPVESVNVVFKTKETKFKRPIDYVTEEDLAAKYAHWITKFEKSLRTFADLVNRCALKSKGGVAVWITSLCRPWQ